MHVATCFLTALCLLGAARVGAQCAAGIPAAGNPGCVPPTVPGSPYSHDQGNVQAPMPPPAKWSTRWGAVAVDEGSGKGGTVEDRESEGEARGIAMDLCRRNGGENCKVLIAYHDQCAALAQTPGGGVLFATSAADAKKAERMALKDCKSDSCSIIYSKCSFPAHVE